MWKLEQCYHKPSNYQKLGHRPRRNPFLMPSEGTWPCWQPDLRFQLLELKNKVLLFNLLSLWNFVTAALANLHAIFKMPELNSSLYYYLSTPFSRTLLSKECLVMMHDGNVLSSVQTLDVSWMWLLSTENVATSFEELIFLVLINLHWHLVATKCDWQLPYRTM